MIFKLLKKLVKEHIVKSWWLFIKKLDSYVQWKYLKNVSWKIWKFSKMLSEKLKYYHVYPHIPILWACLDLFLIKNTFTCSCNCALREIYFANQKRQKNWIKFKICPFNIQILKKYKFFIKYVWALKSFTITILCIVILRHKIFWSHM